MALPDHRNRSANVHQFAMIPSAEVPRSTFLAEHTVKTAFNSQWLYPIYCDEVLPGDQHRVRMTAFARLATPVFPIMDNLYLDSFFFFVPCRLVWDNWPKFMGERRPDTDSSIDFTIPQIVSPVNGFPALGIYDHLGLPTDGQLTAGQTITINALPLRAINKIWNEWFRDQNMQDMLDEEVDDGPDLSTQYALANLPRGKRHDYFTSCLPWPQKQDSPVVTPLTGTAPVTGIGFADANTDTGALDVSVRQTDGSGTILFPFSFNATLATTSPRLRVEATDASADAFPSVYADLQEAGGVTINDLRTAFQIQRLLERDARGGTRYTEIVFSQFKVKSPDARLQRPEYIGGGSTPIQIAPIQQQSASAIDGSDTPMGTLAGAGAAIMQHGFNYSATEHGYIIGLINVRADLTYQQGLERMWTRSTRYDFYSPVFAHLGEQAVLRQEIYCTGTNAEDETVFGYQERWAEYRYARSKVTAEMNSTYSTPLDAWHLAELFGSAPVLGPTFIASNPPMDRVIAVDTEPDFIGDFLFSARKTRPMPMYSVPGLMDHL